MTFKNELERRFWKKIFSSVVAHPNYGYSSALDIADASIMALRERDGVEELGD